MLEPAAHTPPHHPLAASAWRRAVSAAVVSLAVWVVFTWPLPRHVFDAIPAHASRAPDAPVVQTMPHGDHLQLLYHFWLVQDMAFGPTPWFSNLYEFNTGDDAERHRVKGYYMPFSLAYAVLAPVCGQAFAWNAAGWIFLWLTFWVTWELTRRIAPGAELVAAAAAVVSILLPYRWHALLGGSPTGYAMFWFPVVAIGLHRAARDDDWRGGVWAGLGIYAACICDSHIFVFSVLSAPLWCALGWLQRGRFDLRARATWLGQMRAFAPVVAFGIPILLQTLRNKQSLATSSMARGRGWGEVAGYSPGPEGILSWGTHGITSSIYLGTALLLVAVALVASAAHVARAPARNGRTGLGLALLTTATVAIMLLALGTRGPGDGWAMRLAREWVPFYGMIRQPAKTYSLLPTVLAALFALAAAPQIQLRRATLARLAVAAALLLAADHAARIRPTLCRLDTAQAAYAAVAQDALAQGQTARALVSPLWPGDAAWCSLYQHYAALYRIRMVNGYHPIVRRDYFDTVYLPLESVNKGLLEASQFALLAEMGVGHVIFHENAYPEKVSPFPPGFALRRLLANPRLRLLDHAHGIWSFRIEPTAGEAPRAVGAAWAPASPARTWEAERHAEGGATRVADPACSRGAFARLAGPRHQVAPQKTGAVYEPGMHFLLRARGPGELLGVSRLGAATNATASIRLENADWTWHAIPVEPFAGHQPLLVRVYHVAGTPDVDLVLLTADPAASTSDAAARFLPAATFFHEGETDPSTGAVLLRADRVHTAQSLHGFRLPLPTGRHAATLLFDTPAKPGAALGEIEVTGEGLAATVRAPLHAGMPATLSFEQLLDLPVSFALRHDRAADITVHGLRLEPPDAGRDAPPSPP